MTFVFDRLDELHKQPLKIVVVGHTNHGKTSTIRTLTEDAKFGEVKDEAGATTDIQIKRNHIDGKTTYLISDTPGLENLDELLFDIQQKLDIKRQPKIAEVLQHLSIDRTGKGELVYRTLGQVTDCHAIIYVIDIREPVLACYKDEIECLQKSGCPLVVAFNFSKEKDSDKDSWVEYLKSIGIHTFSEFDAHTRTREDEDKLFKKMQILMHEDSLHEEFLQSWIDYRHHCAEDAIEASVTEICDMVEELVNHSIIRHHVTKDNKAEKEDEAKRELQDTVNKCKNKCINEILDIFGFSWDDLSNETSSNTEAECVTNFNVFDSSRLRWMSTASGAASLAVIGGTIDVFVGGASFGMGAAIGGTIGAATGYAASSAYEYAYDQGSEKITVKTNPQILLLLIGLGVSTARALRVRGRANPAEVRIAFDKRAFKPSKKLDELCKRSWTRADTLTQLRKEIGNSIRNES